MHVLRASWSCAPSRATTLESRGASGAGEIGAHSGQADSPDRGRGGHRRARGLHRRTRRPGPARGPLRERLTMQVIIPLAGKGTRLRPHTHLVPKPLLKVAGRPVMDWVMDRLDGSRRDRADLHHRASQGAGRGVRPGALPDSQRASSSRRCRTAPPARSTWPGRYVREPVLIIFVDTVFEADLTLINRTDADGIIWAKEVEDYQRFGVVVTDEQGYMTRIVEKPTDADLEARQHRALLHPAMRRPLAGDRPRARRARPTRASTI